MRAREVINIYIRILSRNGARIHLLVQDFTHDSPDLPAKTIEKFFKRERAIFVIKLPVILRTEPLFRSSVRNRAENGFTVRASSVW